MGYGIMGITPSILLENLKDLSHSGYLQILIWMISVDVLTGYAKAFKNKKYNSSIGINGLLRHILVVFVMIIIGVYARALQLVNVSVAICTFFIGNYGLSIVENWGELGWPLPEWVKEYFEKIQNNNRKRRGDKND